MDFCDALIANGIDPDKYIASQTEYIAESRLKLQKHSGKMSLREYLEKDEALTILEKFISKLERERIRKKIKQISNPASSL